MNEIRKSVFVMMPAGDEESQQDMFADGSDEEKEGEDLDEKQWRMERYEREKFLESQQVSGVSSCDLNLQWNSSWKITDEQSFIF